MSMFYKALQIATLAMLLTTEASGGITQVGSYTIPGVLATGMDVQGDYAYVGFLDPSIGLVILDISDPSNPQFVGSYVHPTAEYPDEIHVVGDTAYVAYFYNGWKILNVADRSAPLFISENKQVEARGIYAVPPMVYVAARWTSGMHVFDVSNLSAPVHIGSTPSYQYAGNVFASGSLAFLTDGQAGLQAISVDNPSAPVMLSILDTPIELNAFVVQAPYAYLCDVGSLIIADYSDPSNPSVVSSYAVPYPAAHLASADVVGSRAYILDSQDGLTVLDVSDPASPVKIDGAPFPLPGPREVIVRDNHIFAIGMGGLVTYEITAPRTVPLFLHGTGSTGNPAVLYLDDMAPSESTAKYKDSSAVKFSGGNPWKEVGTWSASPSVVDGTLLELGDLEVWVGLKNSDDIGTRFDLRAEIYRNDALLAAAETYSIPGITRNPALAKAVSLSFGAFPEESFDGITDELQLRILTRIGTDGAGGFGGGHSNATGLRLYFDSNVRPSGTTTTVQ